MNQKAFGNSRSMGELLQLSDGTHIHYVEKGDGTPMVLLPGFCLSLYTWRNNIDVFSRYFRVIALDIPGMGYSDQISLEEEPLTALTEILLEFLHEKSIESAILVGASTGALLAMTAEAAKPGTAAALVLESPGLLDYGRSSLFQRRGLFFGLFRKEISPGTVEEILREAYFDETMVTQELIKQVMLPFSVPGAAEQMSHWLRNMDEMSILHSLGTIKCPTLILWGEEDVWHPVAAAEEYHHQLMSAGLHVQRNCGHAPHAEKSREFNRTVLEFLGIQMEKE